MTSTGEGTIAGTAAYMSPEQAQGKAIDARSDVFSFGAVFYEVLSGRRAFEGDSSVDVLSAVLRDDPRPLGASPLAGVVRRCLEKDVSRRYQTMGEVRAALEDAGRATADRRAVDCRPAVRKPQCRQRERILQRWSCRGNHQRSRQDSRAQGHGSHVRIRLSRQGAGHPQDRGDPGRAHRARGQRSSRRQSYSRLRAADQRRGRISPVVGAVRSGIGGCLSRPGRDRRGHRRGPSGEAGRRQPASRGTRPAFLATRRT